MTGVECLDCGRRWTPTRNDPDKAARERRWHERHTGHQRYANTTRRTS